MQDGDLQLWTRPRYVVVVEGVLCRVEPVLAKKRFRPSTALKVTGYNAQWYDVPLKRLLYMKDRWPDTAQDLVTFVSQEFCDQAADFLDECGLQYDEIRYWEFASFASTLRYKQDIQSVYDSDPARLDRYGQLGHAVVRDEDF
jgi:hypothetical protein